MRKLFISLATFILILGLTACDDLCVGPECLIEEPLECEDGFYEEDGVCVEGEDPDNGTTLTCGEGTIEEDGVCILDGELAEERTNEINFLHINGEGHEVERIAYILMEWRTRDYVKYQITYLSCTCRPGDYNFWNVVFVEINRNTNDIRTISFTTDGENGHYNAGMWGDSSGAREQNGITFEQFEANYFPWYIGKTAADLELIKTPTFPIFVE